MGLYCRNIFGQTRPTTVQNLTQVRDFTTQDSGHAAAGRRSCCAVLLAHCACPRLLSVSCRWDHGWMWMGGWMDGSPNGGAAQRAPSSTRDLAEWLQRNRCYCRSRMGSSRQVHRSKWHGSISVLLSHGMLCKVDHAPERLGRYLLNHQRIIVLS